MENYRQKLLQLRTQAPSGLHNCLNQMWYNLLIANDSNVNVVWGQNMSTSCKREIISYFREKGAGLDLKEC